MFGQQRKATKCSVHNDHLFSVVVGPSCEVVDNPLILGMIVKIATFHLGRLCLFPKLLSLLLTNHQNHPNHKSNDKSLNIDESSADQEMKIGT